MSKQNRYIWHDGDIYLVTEEMTNIEEQQAEMDTLSMSHDNLQRELVEIKRLMGKDKHTLIKSNIALNKRVQELEELEQEYVDLNNDFTELAIQNKRYREALEFYALGRHWITSLKDGRDYVNEYGELAEKALEGEE